MPTVFFLINLQFPILVLVSFLAFWAVSFFLDVHITISCKEFARFERNPIFRYLVGRFGVLVSVAVQAALEAGLALMASYILSLRFDLRSVGIIATVFGIAHMMAWQSNKRFLAGEGIGS